MNKYSIPKATLGRLPRYLQYLKSLPMERGANISATTIAKELSLGDVQVRKDLALVSGAGKPKVGYDRAELIRDLEAHLGCSKLTDAVLIGAGRLGRALLEYDGFEDFGVRIVAGFDCNEQILQNAGSAKPIFSMQELDAFCIQNQIRLGIITVGQGSAQDVCDRLVTCGIEAIWNFAPCSVSTPTSVLLKQENLALSLAHLNHQLSK